MQLVVDAVYAIAKGMFVTAGVSEVGAEVGLADIEAKLESVDGIAGVGNAIVVSVQAGGEKGVRISREEVFPFYVGIPVTVSVGSVVIEIEFVLAGISHEVECIPAVDDVCKPEVGVIKICAAVAVGGVGDVL